MKTRVDFAQLLLRRRFTVERWLESEGISNMSQLNKWLEDHVSEYAYSADFMHAATGIVSQKPLKNALVELETDTAGETASEDKQLEQPRRSPKKNPVNNPPRED